MTTPAPHTPPPVPAQPLSTGTTGEVRVVAGVIRVWDGSTWVTLARLALGY